MPIERRFFCEIRQPPVTSQCLPCFTHFPCCHGEGAPSAVPSSPVTGAGCWRPAWLGPQDPQQSVPNFWVCQGPAQGLWGAGPIPSPSAVSPGGTYSQVEGKGCAPAACQPPTARVRLAPPRPPSNPCFHDPASEICINT